MSITYFHGGLGGGECQKLARWRTDWETSLDIIFFSKFLNYVNVLLNKNFAA